MNATPFWILIDCGFVPLWSYLFLDHLLYSPRLQLDLLPSLLFRCFSIAVALLSLLPALPFLSSLHPFSPTSHSPAPIIILPFLTKLIPSPINSSSSSLVHSFASFVASHLPLWFAQLSALYYKLFHSHGFPSFFLFFPLTPCFLSRSLSLSHYLAVEVHLKSSLRFVSRQRWLLGISLCPH